MASPLPTPSSLSEKNLPHSTRDSFSHRNPAGSPPTNVAKGNLPLPSSSPSPAPRHRTLQRDLACLPSPPPIVWNAASASTTLPNAPVANTSATIPSAAPMTLPVDGVPANTPPPTTSALSEKIPLKVDHARIRLLSVLLALVTTNPVSPNARRALQPPTSRWTCTNFPSLLFYLGWIVTLLLGVLFSFGLCRD